MIEKEKLREAIICRENENVLEVSRILRDTKSRHLIVLDTKDKPVGIISTIDLNNRVLSEEKDPKQLKAKDIMTKNIQSVKIEDNYEKAFQIMSQLGTYSIPVTRNNKLLGLLEFTTTLRMKVKEVN